MKISIFKLLAVVVVLVVVLIAPHLASSATFLVNSTDDRIDANPGNGSCDTGRLIIVNGQPERECTLRAAIMEAEENRLPAPDTITLKAGLYRLTGGDLVIDHSLNIVGADRAETIIDGNLSPDPPAGMRCNPGSAAQGVPRVFRIVNRGARTTAQISGVTIRNAGGLANTNGGGAIFVANGARLILRNTIVECSRAFRTRTTLNRGGGIDNRGDLFIYESVIRFNMATAGGGGIANSGTLFTSESTIFGNNSFGENTGGGGILNARPPGSTSPGNDPTIRIEESTVSNNRHDGHPGGSGIFNDHGRLEILNGTISGNTGGSQGNVGIGVANNGGEVFLINSTITGNRGFGRGGGIGSLNDGFVFLANTIVAGNSTETFSDCAGTLESQGFNLVGTLKNPDAIVCDFQRTAGDVIGDDVQGFSAEHILGPLQRNGGLTETHALIKDQMFPNPAINGGHDLPPGGGFTCEIRDQRVLPRLDRCDIGAFEFGVTLVEGNADSKDDLLMQDPNELRTSNPMARPCCPGGTTTVTLTFKNVGNMTISDIVFEVSSLAAGHLVLNADPFRGRRAVGARKSLPPNQLLPPGESVPVDFVIGRPTDSVDSFAFDVTVLGVPRTP